jgi:hypothetical protein
MCGPDCTGTSEGMTRLRDPTEAHRWYEQHYVNCTHVLDNLELVHLNPANGQNFNLSFLENIREVRIIRVILVHGHKLVRFDRQLGLCCKKPIIYKGKERKIYIKVPIGEKFRLHRHSHQVKGYLRITVLLESGFIVHVDSVVIG